MDLQKIESKIYEIRSLKIMLDFDLAELYDVETKALNQAVKRNIKRFPASFMFQLSKDEWKCMRSQIVTASLQSKRNISAIPFAFTEHGVTMLASILRSDKAIQMNIAIVEAFIALRSFSMNYNSLANRIKELEQKYSRQFNDVYEALKYLLEKDKIQEEQENRNKIGY
jgi:hypothetical protein